MNRNWSNIIVTHVSSSDATPADTGASTTHARMHTHSQSYTQTHTHTYKYTHARTHAHTLSQRIGSCMYNTVGKKTRMLPTSTNRRHDASYTSGLFNFHISIKSNIVTASAIDFASPLLLLSCRVAALTIASA